MSTNINRIQIQYGKVGKIMKNRLNNKRGNATVYLIIILLIALGVAALFVKMNWRRFKAEASFGITIAVIVIVILLILFFLIRRSINKAQKEREQKKLAKERAKHEEEVAKLEAEKAELAAENEKLETEVDALEDKLEDKLEEQGK